MNKKLFPMIALSVIVMASCGHNNKQESLNPFLTEYQTPFKVVPFDQIKTEHYMPAFEAGMKEQLEEIDAIVNNEETPTFQNTILPYDKSGETLSRVSSVFFNILECNSDDELLALAEEVMPMLSKHGDAIAMNPKLFERIDYVYQHRNEMGLDDQQIRVVEKYHDDFVRSGAALDAEKQADLSQINEQLSTLSLQFGNNLLKENGGYKLVIEDEKDLAGLPQSSIEAAAAQAKEDGMEGKWVFTLSKPSLIPFLQYADNRDLRKQMYTAYYNRGDNGNEYDNKELIKQMLKLRQQKAQLLGYDNHANYVLAVNTWPTMPPPLTSSLPTSSLRHKSWPKRNSPRCKPSPTRKVPTSNSKAGTGGIMPRSSARRNTTSTRTKSSLTSLLTTCATACSMPPTSSMA